MRDLYFGAASFCVVAAIFSFLYQQSRLHSKQLTVTAPSVLPTPPPPLPPVPPPPSPPPPPATSVKYVSEDHWIVTLPANETLFDTGIPVAAQFQVTVEPQEPAADCQFLMRVGDHTYSSEVVVEAGAPDTQRIQRLFPWSETPPDALPWVDTVKVRLSDSCRRQDLVLDIESASQLQPGDALLQLEENATQRQRVLAGHAAAQYLRRRFESSLAK